MSRVLWFQVRRFVSKFGSDFAVLQPEDQARPLFLKALERGLSWWVLFLQLFEEKFEGKSESDQGKACGVLVRSFGIITRLELGVGDKRFTRFLDIFARRKIIERAYVKRQTSK